MSNVVSVMCIFGTKKENWIVTKEQVYNCSIQGSILSETQHPQKLSVILQLTHFDLPNYVILIFIDITITMFFYIERSWSGLPFLRIFPLLGNISTIACSRLSFFHMWHVSSCTPANLFFSVGRNFWKWPLWSLEKLCTYFCRKNTPHCCEAHSPR